jgi:hypothetical protein
MKDEALKYLQAGAIVPVDMETTILLVNALKEALAQPEQEPIREAFEKWVKALPNYMDTTRFEAGYSDCNTDSAWAAWQAAQPAQEPVENRFVRELREYAKLNADIPLFPLWNVRRALKYLDGYTTPPAQPAQERNFCPRCGKRTPDLTTIHTCTPPQKNT